MIRHKAHQNYDKGGSPNGVRIVTIHNRSLVINCTMEQYLVGVINYNAGQKVQDAFSFLCDDDREFLISGMTKDDWDDRFNFNKGSE